MSEIYGYLNWRRDMKGQGVAEKTLNEHRVKLFNSHNHFDAWHYKFNLLAEHPLTEEEYYEQTIAELSIKYPCPPVATDYLKAWECTAFSIHTKVVSIEEKEEVVSTSKEGVVEVKKLGWFVHFDSSWESIFIGWEKPDLERGQEVDIYIVPRVRPGK